MLNYQQKNEVKHYEIRKSTLYDFIEDKKLGIKK